MNAAETARTRQRRKERRNPQLATRSRHHGRIASPPRASAAAGGATRNDSSSQQSETRHPVAPLENVALAGRCRQAADTNRTRGAENYLGRLSRVDQPSLAAQEGCRVQARAPSSERPGRLVLHPLVRGKLVRPEPSVLGRAADGPDLPAGVRRRVLEPLRNSRPLASVDPDTCGAAGSGRLQALGSSRLRPVAEHREAVRLEVAE